MLQKLAMLVVRWRRCVQVLSTMATQPLEAVAKAGKEGPLQLFQLYVIKDRSFCKSLIQRTHILSQVQSCALHSPDVKGLSSVSSMHLLTAKMLTVQLTMTRGYAWGCKARFLECCPSTTLSS